MLINQKIEWLDGDLSALPESTEQEERGRPTRAVTATSGRWPWSEKGERDRSDRAPRRASADEIVADVAEVAVETVEVEQKAPSVEAERKVDPRNNNAPRSGRRAPQPAANDDNRDRRNRLPSRPG